MKISATLAQKVIYNLKNTLPHQVNFMNVDGRIIASTDPSRVDTLHDGARHVIQTSSPLWIEYDGQFIGAKKGINMPVYYENQIIGVIGITGDREVEQLSQIVKAMTELLIKEAYLKETAFQNREKNRLLIESLIFGTAHFKEELFDLNFSTHYHVIVISHTTSIFDPLHSLLEKHFTYFTFNSHHFIILAPQHSNLETALALIHQKIHGQAHFGIGLPSSEIDSLPRSYHTALSASKWKTNKIFLHFDKLKLGILLSDVEKDNEALFLEQVFKEATPKVIKSISEILSLYAKHNGSLTKCANELFVHKNTFQYQLQKIHKITGYDPRNYQDFTVLWTALLLIK